MNDKMRTSDEIRLEAWNILRGNHLVAQFLFVFFAMSLILGFVQQLWMDAAVSMGIQSWSMFLEAKTKAGLSGLDLSVPSRTIAWRMTGASAFEIFIGCILQGITAFGFAGLFLRAAKGDSSRWFLRAFGGFTRPLGLAGLYFRLNLQIFLWSLLFLVPGIIAFYRYSQAWNLKVENPDWSAGKCLAESCRMMKGNLWRLFCLDCSYWKPITLLLLGILVGSILIFFGTALVRVAVMLLWIVCLWGGFTLAAYMSTGQAVFYLGLKNGTNSTEDKL